MNRENANPLVNFATSVLVRLQELDLRFKLALPFCLILLIVLTTFWLLVRGSLEQQTQRHANALGGMVAGQTAGNVTELVLANDVLSLNVILTQLTRSNSIARAAILDIDDRTITSAGQEPDDLHGLQLRYRAPIALENSLAGHVALTLNPDYFLADRSRLLMHFTGLLLAGLVFCLFTALALAGYLRRHLERIRLALETPRQDSLAVAAEESPRADELQQLEYSCAAFLQHYREQFSELFGEPGQRNAPLRARQQGESVLLCVRVDQIDNLLALLNPATLASLLDQHYDLLGRAARLHGGASLRFTGDTMLLGFDNGEDDPVLQAICCAQLFQMLVQRLSRRHRREGSPTLTFSCALHCGTVLYSRIGSDADDGSTVLGMAVNETLTLAAHLRPGDIGISDDCFQRIAGPSPDYVSRITPDEDDDTDNVPLIHYILGPVLSDCQDLLQRQADRILPEQPEPLQDDLQVNDDNG